jgi:hypothetical protein
MNVASTVRVCERWGMPQPDERLPTAYEGTCCAKFNLITVKLATFMIIISVLHFSNAVVIEGDLYFAAATAGNGSKSCVQSTVF